MFMAIQNLWRCFVMLLQGNSVILLKFSFLSYFLVFFSGKISPVCRLDMQLIFFRFLFPHYVLFVFILVSGVNCRSNQSFFVLLHVVRVLVVINTCNPQPWRVLLHLLFGIDIVCISHLSNKMPCVSSSTFSPSATVVWVLPVSILIMFPNILYGGSPTC